MSGDFGRAFALMREQASEAWWYYTHHIFVEGLKDGSLPKDAFLHYLRQDYIFLTHFARAWALAVAKSETHNEMVIASKTVNALVNEEMQLHVGICQAAGISQEELLSTVERTENLAYTRFVLEAGYSGDLLDLLAGLAPCVMGYGEIGKRLKSEAASQTYADWINTYSSEEYQEVCKSVGDLLDKALIRRLGENFDISPRWTSLCKTFKTATELEVNFWQMGLAS